MGEALLDFYLKSNGVTLGVLAILSIYFIITNWVFIYRYLTLNAWVSRENQSLETLLMGASSVSDFSYLSHFIKTSEVITREMFDLSKFASVKEATKGLSVLSVIASTTPFIGLFGTVVSILDTFDSIGSASGTMSVLQLGFLMHLSQPLQVFLWRYLLILIMKCSKESHLNFLD